MKITITGHRSLNNSHGWVTIKLYDLFEAFKPEFVISGMALGADQIAARVAIDMNIPVIAAIPFEGQEDRWRPHEVKEYHKILEEVSEIEILSKQPEQYYEAVKLLHDRNKWMVDRGNIVVAIWNGAKKGGTANTVRYAKRVRLTRKLPIIQVNPDARKVSRVP